MKVVVVVVRERLQSHEEHQDKINVQNSLKENSICDFMAIQLESPAIESFDPMQAIHYWNQQVTRA